MARPFSRRTLGRRGEALQPQDEPITAPVPVVPGPAMTSAVSAVDMSGSSDLSMAERGASATNGSTAVTRAPLRRHSGSSATNDTYDKPPASTPPPLDDARVQAAKRGDPSSWEAAYLAYGSALMGYLTLRLDNRDDAAEALSETFMRAIDKSSSFRGDAYSFRAWLFSIARNVSNDHFRRRARLVVLPDQPDLEDRSQPSGDDVAILREDVAALRHGFRGLSQADQEVLWLRVCSGLSAADVGTVLGKKPGAVRMQQLRALETLRGQVAT